MTKLIAWAQRVDKKSNPQPPGNSLPLIDRAYVLGYDAVELDVRLTKDGHLVLMHDDDISSTTLGSGRVHDMTLAELQEVRLLDPFDSPSTFIPSLTDALLLNGDRGEVMIDLRAEEQSLKALRNAVSRSGFDEARLLLLAYTPEIGQQMRTLFPKATILLKAPNRLKPPPKGMLTFDFALQASDAGLDGIVAPTAGDLEFTRGMRQVTADLGLQFGTYLNHYGNGIRGLVELYEMGLDYVTSIAPAFFSEARDRVSQLEALPPSVHGPRSVKPGQLDPTLDLQDGKPKDSAEISNDQRLARLIVNPGFFGGTHADRLVVPVGERIAGIRLELSTNEEEFLNLRGLTFFQGGKAVPFSELHADAAISSNLRSGNGKSALDLLQGKSIHSAKEVHPYWEATFSPPLRADSLALANRLDAYGARSASLRITLTTIDGRVALVHEGSSKARVEQTLQLVKRLTGSTHGANEVNTLGEIEEWRKVVVTSLAQSARTSAFKCSREELSLLSGLLPIRAADASDEIWFLLAYILLSQRSNVRNTATGIRSFSLLLNSRRRLRALESKFPEVEQILGLPRQMISRHGIQNQSKLIQSKEEYLDHLKNVVLLMQELGYECGLAYGTLLGAVRENGFLRHDDDVDVVYVAKSCSTEDIEQEIEVLHREFQKRGLTLTNPSKYLNRHVSAANSSAVIDIFPAIRDGKYMLMHMKGMKLQKVPSHLIEPMKLGQLEGRIFPVPRAAEEFLELRYGEGWNEPDPYFEWTWKIQ